MKDDKGFTGSTVQPKRSRAWVLSFCLHMLLFILALGWVWHASAYTFAHASPAASQSTPTIQATAVSGQQLQQEVARLQAQAQKKRAVEKQRQMRLVKERQALAALKRERQKAQQRLALLQKRKAQQAKLLAVQAAQLKQRRIAEQKAAAAKARANALKQQQATLAAAKRAREQKALNQQLLQQQMQSDVKALAQAAQRQREAIVDRYKAQIVAKISQNWLVPDSSSTQASCRFLVDVGPGGVVLNARLLRGSGNAVLDRSAKTAILKASPLPVPKDPALFNAFRQLRLTVRPQGILNG